VARVETWRLAALIETYVTENGGLATRGRSAATADGTPAPPQASALDTLANEFARVSGITPESALRRIYAIRTQESSLTEACRADELCLALGDVHLLHSLPLLFLNSSEAREAVDAWSDLHDRDSTVDERRVLAHRIHRLSQVWSEEIVTDAQRAYRTRENAKRRLSHATAVAA
jgi:hypothetical protein